MLYVVIIFFLVSIYLYALLGGADFGAGIVELFAKGEGKKHTKKLVSDSMAPIWEANHMWLIISVVILFNAFPEIYSQVSISLYIPLILLLVGIVLRGSAFTFRHYDAIKDNSQNVYTKVFEYSSLIVTFFFGLIVGAIVSGKLLLNPTTFIESYITPWFNLFSISIGVFICSLFAFIASVYLIGDSTTSQIRTEFIRKAKIATIIMVFAGGLVFVASIIDKVYFFEKFFNNLLSIILILAATLALPLLWYILSKGYLWLSRLLAGAQLLFILSAFYIVYFPNLVIFKDAESLSFFNSAAPESTLTYLGWALIVGSFIIFPSLFYLFRIFTVEKNKKMMIKETRK